MSSPRTLARLRVVAIIASIGVVLVAGRMIGARRQRAKDQAAVDHQLQLARQEGIPTTVAEYVATLPKVRDEENAAPYYARLEPPRKYVKLPNDATTLQWQLVYAPTQDAMTAAEAVLAKNDDLLKLLEQAVKKPKCFFDRDSSQGISILWPELTNMKAGAKLLALKGARAAAKGDFPTAITCGHNMVVIANHLEQVRWDIHHLVAIAIRSMASQYLMDQSFTHPTVEGFRSELRYELETMREPNLREIFSFALLGDLIELDYFESEKGQKELERSSNNEDPERKIAQSVISNLQTPLEGRRKIIEGFRKYFAALKIPVDQSEINAAMNEVWQGRLAFPKVAELMSNPFEGDTEASLVRGYEERRTLLTAFLRATETGHPAKSIRTDDLLSPINGKPISYSYDGSMMHIDLEPDSHSEFKKDIYLPRHQPKKG